jgi:plastocyanin
MTPSLDRRHVLVTLTGAVAAIVTAARAEDVSGSCPLGREPKTHDVMIESFAFVPAMLSVIPGDQVRWTNLDLAPHTATADDDTWDTGEIAEGQTAVVAVTQATTLSYHCIFHPQMLAELALCPA